MKRYLSLCLALVLTLTLSAVAFASSNTRTASLSLSYAGPTEIYVDESISGVVGTVEKHGKEIAVNGTYTLNDGYYTIAFAPWQPTSLGQQTVTYTVVMTAANPNGKHSVTNTWTATGSITVTVKERPAVQETSGTCGNVKGGKGVGFEKCTPEN